MVCIGLPGTGDPEETIHDGRSKITRTRRWAEWQRCGDQQGDAVHLSSSDSRGRRCSRAETSRTHRHVQLEVEPTRGIDLRDLSPLASFGMDRTDLLGEKVDRSRLLGHAVAWLGCAGLLVPSARHSGDNIVIYTNEMAPTDRVDLS
jgi:hypothetical protein